MHFHFLHRMVYSVFVHYLMRLEQSWLRNVNNATCITNINLLFTYIEYQDVVQCERRADSNELPSDAFLGRHFFLQTAINWTQPYASYFTEVVLLQCRLREVDVCRCPGHSKKTCITQLAYNFFFLFCGDRSEIEKLHITSIWMKLSATHVNVILVIDWPVRIMRPFGRFLFAASSWSWYHRPYCWSTFSLNH